MLGRVRAILSIIMDFDKFATIIGLLLALSRQGAGVTGEALRDSLPVS